MSTATIVALVFVLAAIITLIPRRAAPKKSGLGYRSVCSFAPMSTGALVMIGAVVWLIGNLA